MTKRQKRSLMKLAHKHLDIPENIMFMRSSGLIQNDAIHALKVFMVEFYLKVKKEDEAK
jgi:hypothetical protein